MTKSPYNSLQSAKTPRLITLRSLTNQIIHHKRGHFCKSATHLPTCFPLVALITNSKTPRDNSRNEITKHCPQFAEITRQNQRFHATSDITSTKKSSRSTNSSPAKCFPDNMKSARCNGTSISKPKASTSP